MPTKSKSAKPVVKSVSLPKYKNGAKVYLFNYRGSGLDEILECEISVTKSALVPRRDDVGKVIGQDTHFTYLLETKRGQLEVHECSIFPNYVEAAKSFCLPYLCLLK